MSDKHISAAIAAIHEASARHWTLQAPAERGGVSRSAFALRFKEMAGASPMELAHAAARG
jgi:AraC-like DNA-binding protein